MDDKSSLTDVKVGAFILLALMILVVGSLWIAGSTFFGAQRVSYTVLMKNSAGVQAGDRVRFAGVSVGRIQRVGLRPEEEWPVVMEVALKPDIPVRTDSTARIATSGFLGSSFLLIEPGSPTAPLLSAGGEIHGQSGPGLEDAMAHVDEISYKVIALLDRTAGVLDQVSSEIGPILSNMELLLSEENSENMRRILSTLQETADDAAPRVSSLLARLESISQQVEEGVEGMPALMAKVSDLGDDVQTAFGPNGSRLAGALEAAESSLASADEVLGALGRNPKELEEAVRDLRDTVANLKAFSQAVKERPFSLIRIKVQPDRKPGHGVEEGSP